MAKTSEPTKTRRVHGVQRGDGAWLYVTYDIPEDVLAKYATAIRGPHALIQCQAMIADEIDREKDR